MFPPEAGERAVGVRRWLVRLVILGACVGALVWTVIWLGPAKIAAAARAADPGWLLLAVALVGLRYLVWGFKWWLMLRRRGAFGFGASLTNVLAGVFVNLTTPSAKLAGGFVRAAFVNRRTGWGFAPSYGWSLADQFTNTLGNIVLGGIVMLSAGPWLPPGSTRTGLFVLGTLALAGPLALVALRGWAWRKVDATGGGPWLRRLAARRFPGRTEAAPGDWIRPVLRPLLHEGTFWRVVAQDLGLAAFSCSFLCLSNACSLRAVGVEVPFFQAAAALILAGFAGTLSGAMGGVGATEIVLIGMLGRFHVPAEAAAAGALLHRSAYYAVSLGWGALALLLESRRKEPSVA